MSPLEIHAWLPEEPDEPEALALGPAAESCAPRAFDWAFRRNPAGTRLVLARRAGRVVGRYAALPVRTRVLGEPRVFASLLGSGGDDEEARRAAAEAFVAAHGGPEGDLVHYGWPDAQELAFGQRYLEHELLRTGTCFLRSLAGPVDPVPASLHAVARFGPEADQLYAWCATHWNASAIRDAAFLNWRFFGRPERRLRVLGFTSGTTLRGYAVVQGAPLAGGGPALLVDWLVLPGDDEASAGLVAAALAAARAEGATELAVSVPEWSPWAQFFQARGFRHHASAHLAVVRASVPRFDMLWLRDNWWTTFADVLHL
jgi:hypothetical protein